MDNVTPGKLVIEELLALHARTNPDLIAIIQDRDRITYEQLNTYVVQLSRRLELEHITTGTHVAISLPTSAVSVIVFLALLYIDAVPVLVDPKTACEPHLHHSLFSTDLVIITLAEYPPSTFQWNTRRYLDIWIRERETKLVMVRAERETHKRVGNNATASTIHGALVLFSSGSRGEPKAIWHPCESLLDTGRDVGANTYGITRGDRIYSTSRIDFAYGLGNSVSIPLFCGATSILDSRTAQISTIADVLEHTKPTVFFSVPSVYEACSRLSHHLDLDFSSVRIAISAGEPLSARVAGDFRSRFGLEILNSFGATETLHHVIAVRPRETSAEPTCGTVVPNRTVEIRDLTGSVVPDGAGGLLWIKQKLFAFDKMKGSRSTTLEQRWVCTGDRFLRTATGHFVWQGRNDDFVKVRGRRVHLESLRSTLQLHAHVKKAAVICCGDGLDALVVACVSLEDGCSLTLLQVKEFLKAHSPSIPTIDRLEILEKLPLSRNGKLDTRSLLQWYHDSQVQLKSGEHE